MSSDEEVEPEKKREGFGTHAKKFWASKAAGTSLGRKAITHHLGPAGLELLNTLYTATVKQADVKFAKKRQERLLRMALKVKILFDEKIIVMSDLMLLTETVQNLVLKLNGHLKEETTSQTHLESLVANVTRVRAAVVQLLQPYTRPKNLEKLKDLFAYYGGAEFLSKLLNDAEYQAEKLAVTKSMDQVLRPLLDDLNFDATLALCLEVDCDKWALKASGRFRGSWYCPVHHQSHLEVIESDKMLYFEFMMTGEAKNSPGFNEYIDEQVGAPHTARLYQVLTNYKNAPANIRRIFAQELLAKYISPDASLRVQLAPVLEANPEHFLVIEDRKQVPSCELFEALRTQLLEVIVTQAWEPWQQTAAHEAFHLSVQTPEWAK